MTSGNSWQAFQTYFTYSLEFLAIPEFIWVTIGLAVNFAASVLYSWNFRRGHWQARYSWIFTQFLFFPILLGVAVLGTYTGPMDRTIARPPPQTWALWTVNTLEIGALIVGSYFVYRLRGLRWFALSLLLLQIWLMFSAAFIAGMAITGDWI